MINQTHERVEALTDAKRACERIRDESEHTPITTEDYRRGFHAGSNACVVAVLAEINKLAAASPPSDDVLREKVAEIVFRAIHGAEADPFQSPEAWDFASEIADAIIASLTSNDARSNDIDAWARRWAALSLKEATWRNAIEEAAKVCDALKDRADKYAGEQAQHHEPVDAAVTASLAYETAAKAIRNLSSPVEGRDG